MTLRAPVAVIRCLLFRPDRDAGTLVDGVAGTAGALRYTQHSTGDPAAARSLFRWSRLLRPLRVRRRQTRRGTAVPGRARSTSASGPASGARRRVAGKPLTKESACVESA